MGNLAIGEVARQAGVRTSTLRYYEDIGLLEAPDRVNGRRRYDHRVQPRLRAIKVAQRAGFTLSEIGVLLQGFAEEGTTASAQWRELAQRKLVEAEELIARAQGMKRLLEEGLRCNCLTPEECTLLVGAPGEGADES